MVVLQDRNTQGDQMEVIQDSELIIIRIKLYLICNITHILSTGFMGLNFTLK